MSQQSFILSDGSNDVAVLNSSPTGTEYGIGIRAIGSSFTQDAADGPVTPGTVASKSILLGGQFNTSLPTLTNTQQAAVQVDSNGRLLVGSIASALPTGANVIGAVTQSGGPWTSNITQFGSNNVVTGAGAGGSGIPRVTVSNDSNILATQSGTWTVQPGNTANTTPWLITGTGTDNTTNSTNKLPVLAARANTSAPSWTDGYMIPLSTTTSGVLRTGITDGTNTMPTMDAVGRAGYVRITDGTNTLGTLFNTLHADPNGDRRTIHNNATITSSGSMVLTWVGWSEWYLIINIKNAPTGTTPTITFNIDQLDPIDQTTSLTGIGDAKSDSSGALNSAGVTILEISELISDTVKISWTVTGGSPSFTGVNVTFCGHGAGNAIEGQAEVGTLLHDGPVPVAGVDSGNLIRTLLVDSTGALVVASSASNATSGFSFGDVALSSVTTAVVRRTTYTEQASNAQRSIVSSSASDASAGTGIRSVKITYYTATYTGPFTETVTLNGTTPVNTVATDICYIEKLEAVTAGSGGVAAGTISLKAATAGGGATIWTIATGDTRTYGAHHYIATGKTCYITSLSVLINGGGGLFFIKSQTLNVANAADSQVSDYVRAATQAATTTRTYSTPIKVVGPSRIVGWVTTEANTSLTYRCSYDFYDQ